MPAKISLLCCLLCLLGLLPDSGHPGTYSHPSDSIAHSALSRLHDKGNALLRAGKYSEAEAVYESAYPLAVAQHDTALAIRLLHGRGSCRLAASHMRSAMRDFLEALRLAEASNDLDEIGRLSCNIASLYLHMQDPDASRESAVRGLAALRGARESEPSIYLLIHLAKLRCREPNLDAAVQLFRDAIQSAGSTGDLPALATAWHELGYAFLLHGRFAEADSAMVEAFRLRKILHSSQIGSTYRNLGMLRMAQNDFVSASHLLDAAVVAAKSQRGMAQSLSAYYQRGRLRTLQGQVEAALADFRIALDLARTYRLEVLPADSVRIGSEIGLDVNLYSSFVGAAWQLYSRTGRSDLAREAFEAAEENTAGSLRALIAQSPEDRLPLGYPQALARLQRAKLAALAHDDPSTQAEIRRIGVELTGMEVRAGLSGFLQNEPSPARTNLLKRTRDLLGENDALIKFHLANTGLYRWIVTRRAFAFDKVQGGDHIGRDVARFSELVKANSPDALPLGRILYAELFGGAGSGLETKRNWLLILDDALFQLPVAALIAGDRAGRPIYLAERHSTRVIPAILLSTAEGWSPGKGAFLGIGDPVYNRADPRWPAGWLAAANLSRRPIEMPRLTGSGREIEACARIWSSPESPAVLLRGMDASEPKLKLALTRNPAVLHFAVHAIQARQPHLESFLALRRRQ